MRWHITGDSFVEGVGATDGNGWAQRFAVAAPPGQVSIVGIGGSDRHDLVDRLPAEVAGHSGDLVFAVGLNDSRLPE